ncbi:MAG: hypothetical protein JSS50_01675 [Proteobacteria bacterium]|nr:hypothetical protein [Pseudomonadota bacterium]
MRILLYEGGLSLINRDGWTLENTLSIKDMKGLRRLQQIVSATSVVDWGLFYSGRRLNAVELDLGTFKPIDWSGVPSTTLNISAALNVSTTFNAQPLFINNREIINAIKEVLPAHKLSFLFEGICCLIQDELEISTRSSNGVPVGMAAWAQSFIVWPQSLILRNIEPGMIILNEEVIKAKLPTRHPFDPYRYGNDCTFEAFLKHIVDRGTQSLELHCTDQQQYAELNQRLQKIDESHTRHHYLGKLYVAICLDDANGIVQQQTIWPSRRIALQLWFERKVDINLENTSEAKIQNDGDHGPQVVGQYMEDAVNRAGITNAKLEVNVDVSVETVGQMNIQVESQQNFSIEHQAEHQLQHQYQSKTALSGPGDADMGDAETNKVYRLDELLGIPIIHTERPNGQESQTIGSFAEWDPTLLTANPDEKSWALTQGHEKSNIFVTHLGIVGGSSKGERLNKATHTLIVSIFTEYCDSLPLGITCFDQIKQDCSTGQPFNLMTQLRTIMQSNNRADAVLAKKAYNYVARQYVRFMSGLTGAAPVHVDVLGNDDDIAGISWQMFMHKYTLEMGINSWYISESVLTLACNNYCVFKGGIDYHNLPLGFRVEKYTAANHQYKARPSEAANTPHKIRTLSWNLKQYKQDTEANENGLRIDPLANTRHTDQFKQQSLAAHYRAVNTYAPPLYDPAPLRQDQKRPNTISHAGFIPGTDPLDQHINYYRGLQANPPAHPLIDALYDKLPVGHQNNRIREVIHDVCGRVKVRHNILSIVAVYGMEAIAGFASHLLAIRELDSNIYNALINCIGRNTSRQDWSYLAGFDMLEKLSYLIKDLKKIKQVSVSDASKQPSSSKSQGTVKDSTPQEIRKLEVKLQFLEAVLNSASGPAVAGDARSSYTGNTDVQTTMKAFEYFWIRFKEMTNDTHSNRDNALVSKLQQTLVRRTTDLDVHGRRRIILDGVSGNVQTDLYRLYRILDHAAVKGPQILEQQLIALNAEPEYKEALEAVGPNATTIEKQVEIMNSNRSTKDPLVIHPMRCSLAPHGDVYMLDLAKTYEGTAESKSNELLHGIWDPIIITPEMNLAPDSGIGRYKIGANIPLPDVGELAYYGKDTRLSDWRHLYNGPYWRNLYSRRLNTTDEKLIPPADIEWSRRWYYRIITGFKQEYVDRVLEFFMEYAMSFQSNLKYDSHSITDEARAEVKAEFERFMQALKELSEAPGVTRVNIKRALDTMDIKSEASGALVDHLKNSGITGASLMKSMKNTLQRTRYMLKMHFEEITYLSLPSRCLAIWFAAKRYDHSIPAIMNGFPLRNGDMHYPVDPYWAGQHLEPDQVTKDRAKANLMNDQYNNKHFLSLCALCINDTLPKDPRYWKRDLSGFDHNMDRTQMLQNSTALQTMQHVNLWLDDIDWEQVQNFKQVPYAQFCDALKGKVTFEECKKAMTSLFPDLLLKTNLISEQISWDELLAGMIPEITIAGQSYKQWKQLLSSSSSSKTAIETAMEAKQEVRSIIATAVSTIDTWGATELEKQRIAAIVLRHYLLCFMPHQTVLHHESGRAEKLGDNAKAYIPTMLGELVQGDAYSFLRVHTTMDEIDTQIRGKLATLIRLQPMNMQGHMRNIELIKRSYDSDLQHASGTEFVWNTIKAMRIMQRFKKPERMMTPSNLVEKMARTAHMWATPSKMFVNKDGKLEQQYDHDLYKADFQRFSSAVMKFATFAQEIKGYNFSDLVQAAYNLYQLRDLRRYDKKQEPNSSNSSNSSSTAIQQKIEHIPLKLFEILERVCRQQDKMLLVKYVAAFTKPQFTDELQITDSTKPLQCFMDMLSEAPDLVMNLVFSVERYLGKNKQPTAPEFMCLLLDKVSRNYNQKTNLQIIRILDQILRNEFANPEKTPDTPDASETTKLSIAEIIALLPQFVDKITNLNKKALPALEKLVTPPICHSLQIKRDIIENVQLNKEYCEGKSTEFFSSTANKIKFGWASGADQKQNLADDKIKLRAKLNKILIRENADTAWQPLNEDSIETLINGWDRIITEVTTNVMKKNDADFVTGLEAAKKACAIEKNPDTITTLLAYIAVARHRTIGQFPRPLQLIAPLYSKLNDKKNIFHGFNTGQGKTITIALSDAFDALLGAKVVVSTSTYELASRDALGQRKFHNYLELKSSNTPITPLGTTMEEFRHYDIHYGTLSDVITWRLNQKAKGERFAYDGKPMRIRLKVDEIDRDAHSPVKQRLAKREVSTKSTAAWERLLYLIVEMVEREQSDAHSMQLLYAPYKEQPQRSFPAKQNHHNLLLFLDRKIAALYTSVRATNDPKIKDSLEDDLTLVREAKAMLCTTDEADSRQELKIAAAGKLDREAIHSLVEAAIDSKHVMNRWEAGVDYYDVPEYDWNDMGHSPTIVTQYRKVAIVNGTFNKSNRSIIYDRGMQQFWHLWANEAERDKPEGQRRHFVIEPLSNTIAKSSAQEELLGVASIPDIAALEDFGFETCEGYSATMGNEYDEQEFIAHQKYTLIKYPTHEEWRVKGLFENLEVPAHQKAPAYRKNNHILLVNNVEEQIDTLIQTAMQINQQPLNYTGRGEPLNLICETEKQVKDLYNALKTRIDDNPALKKLFPAIQTYTKGMVKDLDENGQLLSYDDKNYKNAREALGRRKSRDKQKDLHAKVVKQMSQLGVITIGTEGTMARGTDSKPALVLGADNKPLLDSNRNPITTRVTTIMLSAKRITKSGAVQGAGRTHGRFEEGRAGFILINTEIADALNKYEAQKAPGQVKHYRPKLVKVEDVRELGARNSIKSRLSRDKSRLADQIWQYLQFETFHLLNRLSDIKEKSLQQKGSQPADYESPLKLLSFVNRVLQDQLARYFQADTAADREMAAEYAAGEWKRLVTQAIEDLPQNIKSQLDTNVEVRLAKYLKAREANVRVAYEDTATKQSNLFFRVLTAPYQFTDLLGNAIFIGIAAVFTDSEDKKTRAAIAGNRVFFMLCMSSTMLFVPSFITDVLVQAGIAESTAFSLPSLLSQNVLGAFNYQTLLVYMSIGMVLGAVFGGIMQTSSQDDKQVALREFEGEYTTLLSGMAAGAVSGFAYVAQQYLLQYAAETLLPKYVSSTILSSPEITLAIMLTTHLLSGILSTIEYSFLNEAINKRIDISASSSGEYVSLIDKV